MGINNSALFDAAERRRQTTVAAQPSRRQPWSTSWVVGYTGVSLRQINYWAALGILGDHLVDLGQGARRRFTPVDVEVIFALVQLAALGCRDRWLKAAAAAVAGRRVIISGAEKLAVFLDGTTWRGDDPGSLVAACWVVPLTACPDDAGDLDDASTADGSQRGAA